MLNRILIDSKAFALKNEALSGEVALRDLDRRVMSVDIADDAALVLYSVRGGVDKWARPFLDLSVSGSLKLYCQRCLKPMDFHIDETARIVLFDSDTELDKAMLMDDELEGMIHEAECDVFTLIEDQLLMALPYSPLHDSCDETHVIKQHSGSLNPFAVLQNVKKSG